LASGLGPTQPYFIRIYVKSFFQVFNVKQGWQPLCDFLGVPVPDRPFPNVNDTKSFGKMMRRIKVVLVHVHMYRSM
jgi:hypothetical protein